MLNLPKYLRKEFPETIDFHRVIEDEEVARRFLDVCVNEIEARTKLRVWNRPSVKMVEEIAFNPYWYSAYFPVENNIFLKRGPMAPTSSTSSSTPTPTDQEDTTSARISRTTSPS